MGSKMLIDAAHPEETRVVVVRSKRVEDFDYESATKKQLRGNIYLAKVTRVEPSLQAAFVDYGGNRHGFLAFSEIHPDYYQIPVADRQALLEEEAEEQIQAEAEEAAQDEMSPAEAAAEPAEGEEAGVDGEGDEGEGELVAEVGDEGSDEDEDDEEEDEEDDDDEGPERVLEASKLDAVVSEDIPVAEEPPAEAEDDEDDEEPEAEAEAEVAEPRQGRRRRRRRRGGGKRASAEEAENGNGHDSVDSVGSEDALEEVPERVRRRRRTYKIQEVIKRRQIILVQVVKEERGNKGAALTTYLSLAGRYTVLMPNTGRGGGISRKITGPSDRKRLRKIAGELEVPDGMGLIVRTAGASRTKAEVKRDYEYLLRLWENVRDLTLKSTAPALVYEEGNLLKRSIRDLYNKDIDEIVVAGDEAYKEAKDFMRMLMPSHAKNVKPYKEPEPIFVRHGVERQLSAMFSPYVTLRSGGYIVINQTEALVSIDVNSGKATREHSIEDTALKTNLEAAEEISRQLRLRDLAGLIVIDFIDMDERRNNRAVERKLKECLRNERARIQVGRISHFGLLEMSRQRLRAGMLEGTTTTCPMCLGAGVVRSTESVSLDVLRSMEDILLSEGVTHLVATAPVEVALYILNQKRHILKDIEQRYRITITVNADEQLHGGNFHIDKAAGPAREPAAAAGLPAPAPAAEERQPAEEEAAEGEGGRRKRRRRRRRRGERSEAPEPIRADYQDAEPYEDEDEDETDFVEADAGEAAEAAEDESEREVRAEGGQGSGRRRRRGRRGGRRSRGARAESEAQASSAGAGGDEDEESSAWEPAGEESLGDDTMTRAAWAVEEEIETAGNGRNGGAHRVEVEPLPEADEPHGEAEPAPSAVWSEPLAPMAEAEPAAVEEPADEPVSRRRGWWQRRLSGPNG